MMSHEQGDNPWFPMNLRLPESMRCSTESGGSLAWADGGEGNDEGHTCRALCRLVRLEGNFDDGDVCEARVRIADSTGLVWEAVEYLSPYAMYSESVRWGNRLVTNGDRPDNLCALSSVRVEDPDKWVAQTLVRDLASQCDPRYAKDILASSFIRRGENEYYDVDRYAFFLNEKYLKVTVSLIRMMRRDLSLDAIGTCVAVLYIHWKGYCHLFYSSYREEPEMVGCDSLNPFASELDLGAYFFSGHLQAKTADRGVWTGWSESTRSRPVVFRPTDATAEPNERIRHEP